MKSKSPKWASVGDVDVTNCLVTRGGQVLAENSIIAVHRQVGKAMHWVRLYRTETGEEVHSSYHIPNAKGQVAYGQFGSMIPRADYSVLVAEAIEKGIIELPQRTLDFLCKKQMANTNDAAASVDVLAGRSSAPWRGGRCTQLHRLTKHPVEEGAAGA